MKSITQQDIIAAVAREVVEKTAPAEIALFPAIEKVYFERGGMADAVERSRESPLGFGLGAEITALAPAALLLATEAFRFAATKAGEAVKHEAGAVVSERIKALFKRFHSSEAAHASLSPSQLAELRSIVRDRAVALRIPLDKASLLADAIVGALVAPR